MHSDRDCASYRARLSACARRAHHALGQRAVPAGPAHERAADLQRAPDALLGQQVRARPRHPVHARGAARRRQLRWDHDDRLAHVRHDRRARALGRRTANLESRGFPAWITLPSYRDLATGRRWHFFFAWLFVLNGLVYLVYTIVSGHVAPRPRADAQPSCATSAHAICEHVRFHFPKGEEAKRYNVLQKLAYLASSSACAAVILTGLTMSPGIDAAFPCLLDLFGGRQSARTIHFLCALWHRAVRHRARLHGAGLGRLEQPALDDHRPLRDRDVGGARHGSEPHAPHPPRAS